ncbi:NAD-dependent epimerase/dehydratase family protein [Kitasatospora sp. CM 4170]|uniref:NAD-dependent epimerase/dehydratase family protein n=1 Tax=Kitasatospora aburaviensis TaxID=67265 RepID=A0ABW1F7X6_9ACTN|nr:NAD-dependent epimerase/dehydratase family protein [Kitasatospora sp. CM 4170]WNM48323.1 NAD-dependent epimerase/dehydratase family protein [Kitasatospora sp. CM 4170]
MRNLVTGASGFLGSHLVEGLLAAGEDVTALVRRSSDRSHLDRLGVDVVEADLLDRGALVKRVAGFDRVFHCAAMVKDWGTWSEFRAANVTSVQNLLEASAAAGVGLFVHVSSTDVYGHPDRVVDESAPLRRRGFLYGDTKIEAEELLWQFIDRHDLPTVVVRPASLYGPRSKTFVDDALKLLREGTPMIPANRSAGLTEVSNAVDAILLLASDKRSVGRAFNITDDSPVSWQTYFERLAEIAGLPRPRFVPIPRRAAYTAAWAIEAAYRGLRLTSSPPLTRLAVDILTTEQGFSSERLRSEFGYRPRIDFEEGMRRLREELRGRPSPDSPTR